MNKVTSLCSGSEHLQFQLLPRPCQRVLAAGLTCPLRSSSSFLASLNTGSRASASANAGPEGARTELTAPSPVCVGGPESSPGPSAGSLGRGGRMSPTRPEKKASKEKAPWGERRVGPSAAEASNGEPDLDTDIIEYRQSSQGGPLCDLLESCSGSQTQRRAHGPGFGWGLPGPGTCLLASCSSYFNCIFSGNEL